jgi:hypothetical protein
MLNPVFFAPRPQLAIPGSKYEIIWYAQSEEYTLLFVRYTPPNGLQPLSFEVLYRGEAQIAGDEYAGEIEELYTEVPEEVRQRVSDPRQRLPQSSGGLGVPDNVALYLRKTSNRTYFQ